MNMLNKVDFEGFLGRTHQLPGSLDIAALASGG
jgi:hypothetical protein